MPGIIVWWLGCGGVLHYARYYCWGLGFGVVLHYAKYYSPWNVAACCILPGIIVRGLGCGGVLHYARYYSLGASMWWHDALCQV